MVRQSILICHSTYSIALYGKLCVTSYVDLPQRCANPRNLEPTSHKITLIALTRVVHVYAVMSCTCVYQLDNVRLRMYVHNTVDIQT